MSTKKQAQPGSNSCQPSWTSVRLKCLFADLLPTIRVCLSTSLSRPVVATRDSNSDGTQRLSYWEQILDASTTTLGYLWPISFKGQGIGSCQAKNNGAKQMSPNVGNFVHDLVEMAKAMETLPQVQAELERANTQIESYAKQVQDREIAIISYKQEIDDLHAKVRSLEVERDDASFRVLEAEDQNHAMLSVARVAQANLSMILATLDPPKPEPVKEPEPQAQPVATPAEGQSVADPTQEPNQNAAGTDTTKIAQIGEGSDRPIPEAVHSISEVSSGKSESSPSVETASGQSPGADQASVSAPEPAHGPYFGKRYRDVSGYVNFHDWLEGGGTEADYYSNRSPY